MSPTTKFDVISMSVSCLGDVTQGNMITFGIEKSWAESVFGGDVPARPFSNYRRIYITFCF